MNMKFESVLHVEDAMGNRDSVEFGYALNEEPNVFNPELGEEELFTPFDSVLEMRGFTLDNYTSSMNIGMSKRVISHVLEKSFNENENCYVIQGNVVFMVNAKYLPVTFSWNHEDFNSVRCLEAATFSTHLAGATVDGWWLEPWLAEESVCASVNNNFSTSLPNIEGFEVVKDVEIEDAGIKTIRGIALGYAVSNDIHEDMNQLESYLGWFFLYGGRLFHRICDATGRRPQSESHGSAQGQAVEVICTGG